MSKDGSKDGRTDAKSLVAKEPLIAKLKAIPGQKVYLIEPRRIASVRWELDEAGQMHTYYVVLGPEGREHELSAGDFYLGGETIPSDPKASIEAWT